ncbi:cytochrome P450 [Amorphoplanes digitatis]|uniref:Cytochrome P450 n=1 Tax=Actinoplanes digitatis TaxID=1868 RepID=A0A7W7I1N4_9ACTN|nr:cytochrome P450 [Actinoplanes digitatis]MBB4764769.1 cytochrome P450 [Actinoplanes digitatis]GID91278.1 cytochrome P450 [Actinoplanes digitatis]
MPDLNPITAVTAADPYPYYAALVADRPFGRDEDLGLWVAADAASVTAVLGEPALRVRPPAAPVPPGIVGTPAGDVFGRLVRMTDGEPQQRLKRAVVAALTTADADRVAALTAERTAYAIKQQASPRDFMFAVPAQVVAVLSGLDDPAADEASTLIADFVQCIPATATPEQNARAATAAAALRDLLGPALDARGDGLLAELVRAAGPDAEPAAVLANGLGLLSQTFDATAGLIGNTLVALARDASLRGSAPTRAVVAEVARHDAPIQNTRRFAAEPVVVAGTELAAGDAILVVLAAANRDPAVNEAPAEFRTDRSDPAVFTFGAGAHGCPGRLIATTIAAAVVDALLSAGIAPAAAGPVTYLPLANARIPAF